MLHVHYVKYEKLISYTVSYMKSYMIYDSIVRRTKILLIGTCLRRKGKVSSKNPKPAWKNHPTNMISYAQKSYIISNYDNNDARLAWLSEGMIWNTIS